MTPDAISARRLIGLFFLGYLLFNYPLLSLFNRPLFIMGVPMIYAYLFTIWGLLIVLTVFIVSARRPPPP
ncbi:MAG: hypothetical protein PVJ53_02860 [Desulfobacterales bacterium]|jgi:hypothetical protein